MERQCAVCGESKEESRFRVGIGGAKRNVCRACQDEVEYVRIKTDVLKAYGRKCACCGEDNPLFLQLDHVNNDGGKYRRETGHITTQTYRMVRRLGYPKDFQLLCTTCNFAKGHHGVCPHQSGRTAKIVWAQWEAILSRRGKRYRFFQKGKGFTEQRPWKSEEMVGNERFPKTRGERGRFSKSEVEEGVKRVEAESFKR